MIKNHYFIRFFGGTGGVHLSNLISLDPSFNPRVVGLSKDQYVKYLLEHYSMKPDTAHLTDHYIINDRDLWTKYLSNQNFNLPNAVHIGHAASFDWVADILIPLPNKKFISLTFNSEKSIEILQNRLHRFSWPAVFNEGYIKAELQYFYQKEFISTDPTVCNDDINLYIEVEDLFNKDISFVVDSINKKFNLDIPLALAQNLHDLWVN